MTTTNGTVVDIEIPSRISTSDMNLLQRCEGRVLFLSTVRARLSLSDVDYNSYCIGGVEPDTLGLLAAFRARYPAVISRVLPSRISAVVLGVSQIPAGLTLQNSGPFDLCNGDAVCFFPSVFEGVQSRLHLASIDADLVFPAVLPAQLAREVLAKTMARATEAVSSGAAGAGQGAIVGAREADVITYNGRRYTVAPTIRRLDSAESSVRTLLLNMLFAVNEGSMLVFALIPNLLTLGANDGYVNALVGLESATRATGQLLRIGTPPAIQDAGRRFPLYEALAAWIQMAQHLGEQLSIKPMLRVCTFDGPSSIKAGEQAPVISNWF
ncbi:capsid triplex subunit 2 [Falconid herpesvirus 1]|uniref:Capsid triplex subunit 2 n=2 Tax=Columbid alphaherpesvirus 1 TaxID=93386 RepID=A0A068EVW5_9ALPH|nr:capsid triplex subunit 2 [Falconid herpesvirus 1]YP_009352923.1 capsid triplex subunit 2 [Columbid alphaherpesvirus 1]AID52719.1 capsid triplex subunit 2 [Falconid herpesvirus 1]ARD71340.1 capsid triplex subunit 2 [Columbid alphaherpesvirus 1]